MKYLLICLLAAFHFSAHSQIYVNLEIVNGVPTFQTESEVVGISSEDLHKKTIQWLDETFPSEEVINLNTAARVSAKYSADYTIKGNHATFKHDMQIDLSRDKIIFTITDRSIKLIHANGDWKKHLSELRVKFEKGCNELFWSYEKFINEVGEN